MANYENVTIPTNIEVAEAVVDEFGAFYAALFDKTLEENPGAVITEYAWDASTCDPCPGPTLTESDFLILGADVLPSRQAWGYVLTRLHLRYTSDSLGEDLVFTSATPIVGGREWLTVEGQLERGATADSVNNFQGRYIIRHYWEGRVTCDAPEYGMWGGPPDTPATASVSAAQGTAFVARDAVVLTDALREPVPELGITAAALSNPASERALPGMPITLVPGLGPVTQSGLAGGSVAANTHQASCVGFIAEEPNHTLVITGDVQTFLSVTSSGDPMMLVDGPSGVFCNDDFNGLQPALDLALTPGEYEVFIGTYSRNPAVTPYELTVQQTH